MPIRKSITRHSLNLALAAVFLLLAGCASIDFDKPKTQTTAVEDTFSTRLGIAVAERSVEAPSPDHSAFMILWEGIDSLASRIILAKAAERTIDAQYYLFSSDETTAIFVGELLMAADRGVRVRLLVDDILTGGHDRGMVALDQHPNFEVRIWNPFKNRSFRAWEGMTNFGRVNRRMHNKSFTLDNQVTMIGGRNIGAEYFGARDDYNFGDLDVIGFGPVVQDTSNMFDLYWNDDYALPASQVIDIPEDPEAEIQRMREIYQQAKDQIAGTDYEKTLERDIEKRLNPENNQWIWAPYELVYDSPEKSRGNFSEEEMDQSIITPLREAVLNAERELLIISPYFVPRKNGEAFLTDLQNRGVQIQVLTNSLAATNHNVVHSGYKGHRKPMLKEGVEIYEVRPDITIGGTDDAGKGDASSSMHTKGFVVDRETMFMGSFNWDPRSAIINTELGLIIHSPELAGDVAARFDAAKAFYAYSVTLDERNKLVWTERNLDGSSNTYSKEPQTSWWTRFKVGFMGLLPIKSQL